MSNESKFENEYKNYKVDFIQLLDELDEGRWAHEPDMRAELDEVYAEAAKADEYEAKAKAFDEIIYAINSSSNPGINGSSYIDAADFTSKAAYIVRKYESGESDE